MAEKSEVVKVRLQGNGRPAVFLRAHRLSNKTRLLSAGDSPTLNTDAALLIGGAHEATKSQTAGANPVDLPAAPRDI